MWPRWRATPRADRWTGYSLGEHRRGGPVPVDRARRDGCGLRSAARRLTRHASTTAVEEPVELARVEVLRVPLHADDRSARPAASAASMTPSGDVAVTTRPSPSATDGLVMPAVDGACCRRARERRAWHDPGATATVCARRRRRCRSASWRAAAARASLGNVLDERAAAARRSAPAGRGRWRAPADPRPARGARDRSRRRRGPARTRRTSRAAPRRRAADRTSSPPVSSRPSTAVERRPAVGSSSPSGCGVAPARRTAAS